MPLTSGDPTRALPLSRRAAELEEYFAPQRTGSSDLPDPEPIVRNLTRGILEVFDGVRDIEQLARWLSEDAYRALLTRANLSARARSARGVPAIRRTHVIGNVHLCIPADGVVEAVVIVSGVARTRAVAIRLEGLDRRWRASSLALL